MKFTYHSTERMNELVAKANKALKKLDLDPITVASVTPRKEKFYTESGNEAIEVLYDAELVIPTALVQIAGQEVVARIEEIEGFNLITRLGRTDVDLTPYREAAICCDHCRIKRFRKSSWVVNSQNRGLIQVGNACVALYFGIDVERLLLTSASVFSTLESDEFGPRGKHDFPFQRFVAAVVWKTMTQGFITKKHADEYATQSTCAQATWLANPGKLQHGSKEEAEWEQENSDYNAWIEANATPGTTYYEQVLDWWLEKDDQSEFEHNCKVSVLALPTAKFLGLSAYATMLWVKATTTPAEAEKLRSGTASEFVGTQGKRATFTLKVVNIRLIDGNYGTTWIYLFEDGAGNQLKWYASSHQDFTLGRTYAVKGTVKAHSVYENHKQTVLSRCVILEECPATLEPACPIL